MKRPVLLLSLGLVVVVACGSGDRGRLVSRVDGGLPDGQVPGDGTTTLPDAGRMDSARPDSARPDAGGPEAGGPVEIPCTSDKDCTDHGLLCDVLTQICVECLFDSDCGSEARCVENECASITRCEDSRDCVDDELGRTICDEGRGECVECLAATDCPDNHDCEENRCRAFIPCVNSLDCPSSMVCDTTWGRCLECVRDEDCSAGEVCVAAVCRRGCDSDNDCTPFGLLCDHVGGYCAECLAHQDCAEQLFCSLGTCVRDICRAGSRACQNNTVVVCSQAGDAYSLYSICGAAQSCLESPPTATCEDWICSPPGQRTCSEDHELVIDCAADGLSSVTVENCARNDELCVVDECLPVVCVPDEERCDGDDRVLLCAADGTDETVVDDCQTDEYCDSADTTCKAQICVPDQPACNDNVATTCNSRGNGYESGGTDCDATSDFCVDGDCVDGIDCGDGTICPETDVTCLASTDGLTAGYICQCDTGYTGSRTACSTLMPVGTASTTYSYPRGLWFQAPTDFTITGVRVPTNLSTSAQSIQVIRFNSSFTPGSTTSDYTNLFIEYNLSSTVFVEMDIDVSSGDLIGILGTRGGYGQYASAVYYTSQIDGQSVTLYRLASSSSMSATGVTSVVPYDDSAVDPYGVVEMLWRK